MLGNDVVDLLDVDARAESFRPRFDARVFAAEERAAIAAEDLGVGRASRLRWAHWAAKEAAYKLMKQADPKTVFAPGRFVARFEPCSDVGEAEPDAIDAGLARACAVSGGTASVRVRRGCLRVNGAGPAGLGALELRSFETSDFVHVVALPEGGDWSRVVCGVEARAPSPADASSAHAHAPGAVDDASLAVRRFALRALARELAVEPGRLAIKRNAIDRDSGERGANGRRDRIPMLLLDGRATRRALSLSHHGRFVAFALAPRGRAQAEPCEAAGAADDTNERAERDSRGTVGSPHEHALPARRTG